MVCAAENSDYTLHHQFVKNMLHDSLVRFLLLAVLSVSAAACVNVGARMADVLSDSILNQRDPKTVEDGLPAYLLLLDGMIRDRPEDQVMLMAGARLYSAYAGAFVSDPDRAQLMSAKALDYSRHALCKKLDELCRNLQQPLDSFNAALNHLSDKSVTPVLYSLASSWAGWIQANSDNWQAIADLPKVEAMMRKILELDENYEQGGAHLYLGILLCLRPTSLGGQPEQGKVHFERARELSQGHNLMVDVMYARYYARLVFDQELHDRLLNNVLKAEPEYPDMTLVNVLAQKQARELLSSSKDYF